MATEYTMLCVGLSLDVYDEGQLSDIHLVIWYGEGENHNWRLADHYVCINEYIDINFYTSCKFFVMIFFNAFFLIYHWKILFS